MCAQWIAKAPRFLHEDSEDSDQTGRIAIELNLKNRPTDLPVTPTAYLPVTDEIKCDVSSIELKVDGRQCDISSSLYHG